MLPVTQAGISRDLAQNYSVNTFCMICKHLYYDHSRFVLQTAHNFKLTSYIVIHHSEHSEGFVYMGEHCYIMYIQLNIVCVVTSS